MEIKPPSCFRMLVLLGLGSILWGTACSPRPTIPELPAVQSKQKGAHVFGNLDSTHLKKLQQTGVEWVSLVTWGYMETIRDSVIAHHNGDSTMLRQSNESFLRWVAPIREAGFKVFVKPHVWISELEERGWRSDVYPVSESGWERWKKTYRNFILRYARLSEAAGVEMFCVGTELTRLSLEKPIFWQELIREVRRVFSGKLTYAANWYREYEEISFWSELDYIGIQAYFPLVKKEYPTVEEISAGWQKVFPAIEAVRNQHRKNVLFTEMGYKSTSDGVKRPWDWIEHPESRDKVFSLETQQHAYEAFFQTVWPQKWMAGVHIWQLRMDYEMKPDRKDRDFTPRGKPAEAVLRQGFK